MASLSFSYVAQSRTAGNEPGRVRKPLRSLASAAERFNGSANIDLGTAKPPYLKRLEGALEIVDIYDFLVELAQNRSEPWRRYDQPGERALLDRWLEATAKPGISLLNIHHIVSGDAQSDFRDHEIVAGGDIMVNGNGYYRVTQSQKEALDANPWLRLEYVDDPKSQSDQPTYLARHRYPSADHYKVYGREMLGDAVFEKLEAADREGILATRDTKAFKALTKLLIATVVANADRVNDPVEQYVMLICLHPFGDYNGRSTRAFFKTRAGYPLFLRVFDNDMFAKIEDLKVLVAEGSRQMEWMKSGLAKAYLADKAFPKYFDAPELWQVGLDDDRPLANAKRFVSDAKAFYNEGKIQNLIRQKRFNEVDFEISRRKESDWQANFSN